MTRTYRLGVIGFAHMHVNTLIDHFHALPNVRWVACADTVPATPSLSMAPSTRGANLKRAHEQIGIPTVYADYREMLEKERLDVVLFCPENARHAEVAQAIAAAGCHMVTEKPMAADLSQALRMARAAAAHKVLLMVNWPLTWSPANRKAKELIDAGVIGDVLEVKWRNGASMGPLAYGQSITPAEKGAEWWHQAAAGGGALLDYCCYGACLSRWFIGQPAVAAAGIKANLTSTYGDAEDNAIITVRYPQALAILEGAWTTWAAGVPTGPIIYGTRGALVVGAEPVRTDSGDMPKTVVMVYTTRHGEKPDQVLEGDPLPAGRANLAEETIHCLETGDAPHITLQVQHNLEAMAILDAGIRSAASGKLELVDSAAWCIG
jgi:predicted dehydrogenase